MGSPHWGRQIEVGRLKLAIFDQYHAKMSLDRSSFRGLLATCSMLAVFKHRKPYHQFVDVSVTQ